jgi:arylsulfatase A-like enzyme
MCKKLAILCVLVLSGLFVQSADKPNIILIMGDDMGFSDIGCYGSEIKTPNLDALADKGLRFTQFYNASRCCPTRAALMTGVYQHQAGVGLMVGGRKKDMPGYQGELSHNVVTIAEALKANGYGTYMSGKWHLTAQTRHNGDKSNWPMQRGYDRYYGTITGAGSFFDPATLCRDNTYITPVNDPVYKPKVYYYTDAISDNAVMFLKEHHEKTPKKPAFLYVAYTTAHWPMHALPEDIAKYKGKYDGGFEPTRQKRLEKMKVLGLVKKDTKLSPQSDKWEDNKNKEWDSRNMEVYAAMIDNMDQGIGRIVAELKRQGTFDNTLIMYLQDNGGCAEGYGRYPAKKAYPEYKPLGKDEFQKKIWPPMQTRDGRPVKVGPDIMAGPANSFCGYGRGWANVSNTPFREYKHYAHEGGISTPFIVSWPKGVKKSMNGDLVTDPCHIIDVLATSIDISNTDYPKTFAEKAIIPKEGISFAPAFQGNQLKRDDGLYWEHHLNGGIRYGDWKLVRKGVSWGKEQKVFEWELYNISEDRIEMNNIAKKHPEKVKELEAKWQAWAKRALVKPWPFKIEE